MGGPITVQGAAGRHAVSLELARSIATAPEASSALSA